MTIFWCSEVPHIIVSFSELFGRSFEDLQEEYCSGGLKSTNERVDEKEVVGAFSRFENYRT